MASIVLGLGKTGLSVARFLIERGTMVYGYDDWKESGDCPSDVIGNNHFRWISHSEALTLTSREVEEGVVSPGLPGVHPILRHLEAEGIPVVSEIELASRSIAFPLIGVTGSNGKSTTVSLIGTFLSHAGYSVFTGGNLGTPLLDAIRSHNHYDWGVVELSSFQLERIYTARFQVAGILNLYPNHLDRHLTLVNYFATKKRIFENQKRTDLAVVNLSTTPWHTKLCREVPSRIVPITTRGELREGFFFHRDTIIEQFLDGGKRISCQGWRLPGFHNRENLLFACAVARTLNVPVSQIEQALPGFEGLPHRIQKVGEVEGVVYYDDSKSTTPAATRVAVESIPGRIILLIGGRAKMKDFTELKEVLLAGRVKAVVVFGEHQVLLQRFVPEEMECHLVSNLPQAVNIAHLIASPGEKVLLSPACSSWDQYLNFEERGEHFKRLVYELR